MILDLEQGERLVQIITPVFNEENILLETFDSIKRQSSKGIEWLLVNDGSTNQKTKDILLRMSGEVDWVKVVEHSVNLGLPAARNTGIKASRAPYLFFLDSDDLIDSTFIEKAYLTLSLNKEITFVNSYVLGFGAQNYKWTGGFHDRDAFLKENRNTSCFMARREVFEHVLFDETMKYGCEDWDFWLNAASKGFWGYTIPEFLFYYRRSAENKWATLEGSASLIQIQEQLNNKYAPSLIGGFPNKEFTKYTFGYTSSKIYSPTPDLTKAKNSQRIIFIFPWLKIGGADQFNFNLLKGLKEKGWEMTVITTLKSDHPWEEKFREVTDDIFHLSNLGTETSYVSFLMSLIISRAPRLMFLSNSMFGYYALPLLKQQFPTIPIVDYVHCEDPGWFGGGYPHFSTLFSSFLDARYTTSHDLKNWCVSKGDEAAKIEVKYINVDTKTIKRDYKERKRIREKLNLQDETPLVLYVARLTQQKQPDVLVYTLDVLHKKGLRFKCVIIGDGPDQASLLEALKRKKLDSKVKYLGSQSNDVVMQYMDAADIFFLPSKYEGIALSIYEAMAKELAVVGANVGGQAELVTQDCGYLVNSDKTDNAVEEYSVILEKLINNPELTCSVGKRARERVVTHFDLEEMLESMHCKFLELTASECISTEAISNAYLMVLNRMKHLETENAEIWDKVNSRMFTAIGKYQKSYKRFLNAYYKLKGVVKL